ncbi:hypothetical protein [Laspinema olomoucense]|uniref:Uncharacterized protein n=1 Tax=Laspinema olomoucense D3b TaxID=2953688 RepID=A0ABT2NHJ0_9CYAN|nr:MULTISPECIES: hypothetical protein [unclassified Laspinema]MCT7973772.1 hypothetical protein [Laspinema sp. D3d]MCT7980751.1 hypothetical protein [Laspinema sp. D3b]MCT7988045.1 hypothetical protein [Laspinema sp. D3a]MCT7995128.1 hypothetical protein [Laspinema sp. D3c]
MNLNRTWLKNIRLNRTIGWCLATLTLLLGFTFGSITDNSAHAAKLVTSDYNPEQVDKATVKKIKNSAEDFPSEEIGDTGLKNIRNLGKNIPKVIEQNIEETRNPDNPDAPGTRSSTRSDRR